MRPDNLTRLGGLLGICQAGQWGSVQLLYNYLRPRTYLKRHRLHCTRLCLRNRPLEVLTRRKVLLPLCYCCHLLGASWNGKIDYSRDRVKVVKRGSLSPDLALSFKKMVPGQKIADTQQYEAIEDLALAANRWSKMKPNISVETGRSVMRKLGSRNNEIANALISGLSKSTLRFYDRFISPIPSRPRPIVTTKTIAASTHGGRAGQSSVPRKIAPRAPT